MKAATGYRSAEDLHPLLPPGETGKGACSPKMGIQKGKKKVVISASEETSAEVGGYIGVPRSARHCWSDSQPRQVSEGMDRIRSTSSMDSQRVRIGEKLLSLPLLRRAGM